MGHRHFFGLKALSKKVTMPHLFKVPSKYRSGRYYYFLTFIENLKSLKFPDHPDHFRTCRNQLLDYTESFRTWRMHKVPDFLDPLFLLIRVADFAGASQCLNFLGPFGRKNGGKSHFEARYSLKWCFIRIWMILTKGIYVGIYVETYQKSTVCMYELDRREVRLMLVVISMTLVDFVKVRVKLSQKHFSKP